MRKNKLPYALLLLSSVGVMTFVSAGSVTNAYGDAGSGDALSNAIKGTTAQARFSIILNACNGEKSHTTIQGKYGHSVAFPEDPKRSGYTFVGWSTVYDAASGFGSIDSAHLVDQNSFKFPKENIVLYGAWAVEQAHTDEEVDAYMASLKESSVANHLYYHYYRFAKTVDGKKHHDYNDWDVWAWPYKPTAGEGVRFDWEGRTTSSDHLSASGDALYDEFGGACVDIDLSETYDGGWDSLNKKVGGTAVSFKDATQIGLQIVKSDTRTSSSGFWVNDGSNLYVTLDDYAMALEGGGIAYHIFVTQNKVQNPTNRPSSSKSNPFDGDDGSKVTYGDDTYNDVDFSQDADITDTASDFLGTSSDAGVGAGYQIMVSSFADSDGDGFGDIYGITSKLKYLSELGVKALWLTPIQLSDSYHGYDITDYQQVDPKFGSSTSPAGMSNGGVVTSETALADYKELIKEAHKKGMKVVMDLVLNHTSTSNNWFTSSANLDPAYRGYYQWGNPKTQEQIKEANYWYPYGDTKYSYYAKFGTSMPELNYSYKATRKAVEDMSTYWAKDVGVDGFRLDAVKHIYMLDEIESYSGDTVIYDRAEAGDYSSDLSKNLNFFKELKATVTKDSGKDVFFVGENFDGHAYHVAPYYEAFDSMFDFYSYFNLTSAAATGRYNTDNKFGTASGWMKGNGTYTVSGDAANSSDGDGILAKANNSAWNFPAVYKTYNKYRNGTSLPGLFTSNHDIARVINRIAGTGNASGLSAQGNITTSNYASFEQSANCVKIAELMLPGTTWIYYGDEIGMTGNFPSGKDSSSDYADLWYRQPMKWVQNGKKNDGHYSTDYYVTGSSQKVEMDEVNASSAVVPAETQMTKEGSDFKILSQFIQLKNSTPALIRGSLSAQDYVGGSSLAANVLSFSRTLNGTTYKIAVNFNASAMTANSLSGTVVASYNGATATNLPAYSAIVVKA